MSNTRKGILNEQKNDIVVAYFCLKVSEDLNEKETKTAAHLVKLVPLSHYLIFISEGEAKQNY